nr:MAG TPA: hypothetical protein [Caudoviricetes sp.]
MMMISFQVVNRFFDFLLGYFLTVLYHAMRGMSRDREKKHAQKQN